MATKKRKKPYEYGDELLEGLLRKVTQLFRRRRLMDFDEINARATSLAVTQLYANIDALVRKRLYSLWDELYEIAYLEEDEETVGAVFTDDGQTRSETVRAPRPVRLKPTVGDGYGASAQSREAVNALLLAISPVTKYSYDTELERKRARLFESLTIDREVGNRRAVDADYARAEKEVIRMVKEYFIEVEDDAVIRGYTDSGVDRVMWMSQLDGRVCVDCDALAGEIFDVDKVPPKPHIGCRCYVRKVHRLR